jgi:hypothetical protein
VSVSQQSPLEQALSEKKKIDAVKLKYGIKSPNEMRAPKIQWMGDNNG